MCLVEEITLPITRNIIRMMKSNMVSPTMRSVRSCLLERRAKEEKEEEEEDDEEGYILVRLVLFICIVIYMYYIMYSI